jgi:hypothetical protein
MFSTKRIGLAATILCLCAPTVGQARTVDPVRYEGHPSQNLSGADAQGAPASADEFREFVPAPRVRIVEVPSPGVDWGDATLGAGGAMVLVLLASAGGIAVMRRRDPTHH